MSCDTNAPVGLLFVECGSKVRPSQTLAVRPSCLVFQNLVNGSRNRATRHLHSELSWHPVDYYENPKNSLDERAVGIFIEKQKLLILSFSDVFRF